MALFNNLGGGGDLAIQQQQLDQQRAAQAAQMSPDQIFRQMAYSGGAGLTRGIGGLLGADMIDPELKRTSLRARIVGEIDPQNDDSIKTGIMNLQKAGFAEDAFALSAKLLEREKEKSVISKNMREKQAAGVPDKAFIELAKKSTPSSVSAAIAAGNDIGLLELTEKAAKTSYGAEADRAAKANYGKDFADLSQSEAKVIDSLLETRGVTKAKAGKTEVTLPGVKTAGDVTGLRKDLQAITKPYQDQADAAGDAIDLANMAIKSNNFAAVSSLSRSLAKAAGETQLSGKDVEAFGIDPSLVGSVADTVSKLAKSRPTVDTLTKLRQLAEALKKKAESRISVEEQQLQETARVSDQFTEAQINTVFRRRPAPAASNQKTTRSGVKYTVEKD